MGAAKNKFLLWLNWPVGAFRLNANSLAVFRSLAKGEVTVVRSERAFLRALPTATHAIVWEFKKDWFACAPKLRVLATPGAGRELLPTDAELPKGVVRVNGAFHGAIMSETVIAFMFAHARTLCGLRLATGGGARRDIREGRGSAVAARGDKSVLHARGGDYGGDSRLR